MRLRGRSVHPGSLGLLACGLVVVGSLSSLASAFGVVGFIRAHPGVRWVHPGPLGSLASAMGVIEFTLAHPVFFVFIWSRWVHLRARSRSLGTLVRTGGR